MQATEFLNASDARRAVPGDFGFGPDAHVVTLSGVWELPFRKGAEHGRVAAERDGDPAIGRAAGGFGNALFIGNIQDIALPGGERTPDRWFNTDAGFNKVSAQQLANNIQTFPIRFSGVRADGQSTWNFSLFKNFKLAEKATAQFRAEVYNAMNHPSFDVPNTTPTNSSFGASTAVVSEPRNWQFALKVTFWGPLLVSAVRVA